MPLMGSEYLAAFRARRDRIAELRAELARRSPLGRYWSDPVGFVRDCVRWRPGESLADYQLEVLQNVVTYGRECVRGPRGLGKTCDAALLIHWFALTREASGGDWKIVTTAGAWRQLRDFLWPEVHKWADLLDWQRIGRVPYVEGVELLDLAIKLSHGAASAVRSDKPQKTEGAHADQLLFIFDESKSIEPATFDAAEGSMSTGECYALAISTPGEPAGRFYEIQSRKAGYEDWHVTRVSQAQAIAAGRLSPEWCAKRARQWGAGSALYLNQVEGEFASSSEDSVIPLAWVEAAVERWYAWRDSGDEIPFTCVGVDVARGGADKTVLALRCGVVISELRESGSADTMETTGKVWGILRARGGYAVVDVIGIGAGVVDRLREQTPAVVPFHAGEATDQRDFSGELGFVNKRSAVWWAMREYLDPANRSRIALPPDDMLIGDLAAPKWRTNSRGLIQVESKDDIRKRLGRSTDHGDAVIQAFYTPPPPPRVQRIIYEMPGGISPV